LIVRTLSTLSVFGRDATDQGELTVALQHLGRLGPAERGLDDAVDVAGIETVAGRLLAVDLDGQVRLA
jgi:hypothetical protein